MLQSGHRFGDDVEGDKEVIGQWKFMLRNNYITQSTRIAGEDQIDDVALFMCWVDAISLNKVFA